MNVVWSMLNPSGFVFARHHSSQIDSEQIPEKGIFCLVLGLETAACSLRYPDPVLGKQRFMLTIEQIKELAEKPDMSDQEAALMRDVAQGLAELLIECLSANEKISTGTNL